MKTSRNYISPEDNLAHQLLVNAGSHESQALLVLAMAPGEYYTKHEMTIAVAALLPSGSANWSREDQRPIAGLIRPNREVQLAQVGLTDRGAAEGKAMAAVALRLADEQDISLETLWSSAQSIEPIRPPFGRFLLVRRLLEQGTDQPILVLEQHLPIKRPQITALLFHMAASRLVEYAHQEGDEDVTYSFTAQQRTLWEAAIGGVEHVTMATPDEHQELAQAGQDFITDPAAVARVLRRAQAATRPTSTN